MSAVPFDIGPYRCVERVASNETAELYLAEYRDGQSIAQGRLVRRFTTAAVALPGFLEDLERDARQSVDLDHGNIVRVHGYERVGGDHLLVTDYVDGIVLRTLLDRLLAAGEAMPWNIALRIAMDLAGALEYAQGVGAGVLHGSVCPNNIMLTWRGTPRLLGFGVAATLARAKHQLRDKPASEYLYQSPERLQDRSTDHRSDLFALGAVLFEALAGRAIFDLDEEGNRCLSKKRGRSLGEEGRLMRPVLRRMLSMKPDQRYPNSSAVIEAMEEVLIERSSAVSGTPVDEWLQQVTGADNLADLDFDDADSLVRMPDGRVKGGRPPEMREASLPSMAPLKAAREAAEAQARAQSSAAGPVPAPVEAEVESPESAPSPSRRNLVALIVMGVVAVGCAAAALVLYLQRGDSASPGRRSAAAMGTGDPVTDMAPIPARRRAPMDARARPMDARARPVPSRPRDAMGAAPDARAVPPRPAPTDLVAVPMTGPRKAGELDLITAPKGVSVIYRGHILGQAPLRLRGKTGRKYFLVLNREGYRVKTTLARLSPYGGLVLRDVLAVIPYPVPRASAQQTRVSLTCRSFGILRIYLNGRDTGRNCPAILKVGHGTNNVGVLLPREKRTAFKYFRAKPGAEVKVVFPH